MLSRVGKYGVALSTFSNLVDSFPCYVNIYGILWHSRYNTHVAYFMGFKTLSNVISHSQQFWKINTADIILIFYRWWGLENFNRYSTGRKLGYGKVRIRTQVFIFELRKLHPNYKFRVLLFLVKKHCDVKEMIYFSVCSLGVFSTWYFSFLLLWHLDRRRFHCYSFPWFL